MDDPADGALVEGDDLDPSTVDPAPRRVRGVGGWRRRLRPASMLPTSDEPGIKTYLAATATGD